MAAKIRKGDLVQVMAGDDKGVRGQVQRVQASKNRVWVEKVNVIKRHLKGVAGFRDSEILEKEAPFQLSNVQLIDPETDQPTRVGFKWVSELSEDEQARLEKEGQKVKGRKVRYAKKSGAVLD